MTHSTTIPPVIIRDLSRRSDVAGLVQISGHLVASCGTGWLVLSAGYSAWLPIAIALHAVVLVFLFSGEHEAIHFTAFCSRKLNWIVAWLGGLVLVLPPAWFRCFHLAHHRWTQDPDRDPELARPKPQSLPQYIVWVSGLFYWRDRLTAMLRHAFGGVEDAFVPSRSRTIVVREARSFWAIYGTLVTAAVALNLWQELLLLWVLPIVVGQPFLRLYLLSEHTGCPFVTDMTQNTRTTLTNALVRRLTWNMPYHVEHHAHPGIPFHALPKLHAILAPRIRHLSNGYLNVHSEILQELTGCN